MAMRLSEPAHRKAAHGPLIAHGPIDHGHLARFTLGDRALEVEVLGLFAGQVPVYLDRLRRADSHRAWHEAAHTIKGSARAVGAWTVAAAAEAAEALGAGASRQDRLAAVETLATAIEEARHYVADLAVPA
jgi:HPt (histidine-containing phosphotransfer) domain-containing protein